MLSWVTLLNGVFQAPLINWTKQHRNFSPWVFTTLRVLQALGLAMILHSDGNLFAFVFTLLVGNILKVLGDPFTYEVARDKRVGNATSPVTWNLMGIMGGAFILASSPAYETAIDWMIIPAVLSVFSQSSSGGSTSSLKRSYSHLCPVRHRLGLAEPVCE